MGEHPWGSTDNKLEKHQFSWDKSGGEKESEKECPKSQEETREDSPEEGHVI